MNECSIRTACRDFGERVGFHNRCGVSHVKIRVRGPADDEAILRLNDLAFAGQYESQLVNDLRAANLAAVELTAVEQTAIVSHILFSELDVTHGQKPVRALALAPMSAQPDRQRHGIGSTLVRAGLGCARERGWQAVIATTIRASDFLLSWRARSTRRSWAIPSWPWS
jgi:GNAT superfamily N-acetyltransferase